MQLQTQSNQGFAPVTLDEAMRFSEMLSKSQMVPKAYQNKPEDVLVAVQWGKELGLAPLQALQNIACINGKPSVYGDAAMALVQASPVCEDIEEFFEGEGTPNPIAVCIAHRKGRKPVKATFSVEDAKRAGLWGKQGPWQAYPKRMMQMRARGFALRDAFPDVLKGLITAEEAQDYPETKDITPARPKPANPLDALPPPVVAVNISPERVEKIAENVHIPGTWTDDAEKALVDANDAAVNTDDTVVEIPEESQIPEEAFHSEWTLCIPGKEPHHYESKEAWIEGYKKMLDAIAQAGKASAKTRLEKIAALRFANEHLIQKLGPEDRLSLTAHLARYQATLNEKAKAEQPRQHAV